MDEPTPGLAGTLAGGAPPPMAGTSTTTSGALNTNTHTATTTAPAGGSGGGGATVVQLQQRRKAYFFRTTSSMGTDAGGGWPGAESGAGTPRSAMGDVAGYAAGEWLRQLVWSLVVNGALALLLLGLVEAVVLPVLIASLELTPAPHVSKLLTALLTAHLFQVGARGTVVLLLAVGGSALGLLLTGAWDRGFVPLFLAWYVGLETLARVVGSNGGGSGGGYSGLPSTSSSSALGLGGGPLKTLSETSSARERGWSPMGRWRLWGA